MSIPLLVRISRNSIMKVGREFTFKIVMSLPRLIFCVRFTLNGCKNIEDDRVRNIEFHKTTSSTAVKSIVRRTKAFDSTIFFLLLLPLVLLTIQVALDTIILERKQLLECSVFTVS